MKELSIEEKAQRYDDLLVKLQEAKVDNDVCDERYCCVIDDIVPELAESKDESNDEKIRKALVELISTFLRGHENGKIHGVYAKDILAWLEKQGEHAKFRDSIQVGDKVTRNEDGVLVNLSQLNRVAKKDEKQGEQESEEFDDTNAKRMFIKALERVEEQNNKGYKLTDCDKNSWWEDFKTYTSCTVEQKPAWSEEDERKINYLIALLQNSTMNDDALRVMNEEVENWLKSIRPKFTWKPSDEQMRVLDLAIRCGINRGTTEETTLVSLFNDLKKLK